jgi:PKD repeat protein
VHRTPSTGSPSSWSWNFGDGTNSTDQNPTHTYSKAGDYNVHLTVNYPFYYPTDVYPYATHSKSHYITVKNPPPIAALSATPTSGNAPLTVTFTDTSTGTPTSWIWDFGDGNTSTQENPWHIYYEAGTYTVNLTVRNSNGTDSKLATINVSALPILLNCINLPTDPNNDGLFEDINGNGRLDFADVVTYYNNMAWITQNGLIAYFDYNHNGRIDFNDVVKLYNMH